MVCGGYVQVSDFWKMKPYEIFWFVEELTEKHSPVSSSKESLIALIDTEKTKDWGVEKWQKFLASKKHD